MDLREQDHAKVTELPRELPQHRTLGLSPFGLEKVARKSSRLWFRPYLCSLNGRQHEYH
jgi:hypothetical protein